MNAGEPTSRQNTLQISESRFRAVLENAVDAIVVVGSDGVVDYATPSAVRLLGVAPGVAVDLRGWRARVHPDDSDVLAELHSVLTASVEGRFDFSVRLLDPDGATLHLAVCLQTLLVDPAIRGYVVHVRDLTAQRQIETALAYASMHDSLTGLANRAQLEHRLRGVICGMHRDGVPVAVLNIDLDRFSMVNDAYGHSIGDHVLRGIATRLSGTLRSVDLLARPDSDTFVAVVDLRSRTGHQGWMDEVTRVVTVAERILRHVSIPVDVEDEPITITASIGIALSASPTVEPSSLLRDAEAAMRLAKTAGGNRYLFFDRDMRAEADARHDIERELRSAIAQDRLGLVYQPIVDLRTGTIKGLEALIRLRDSNGRTVLPDDFLKVAEQSGLMPVINDWVLRQATHALAELQHDPTIGEPPYLSFNTTARQVSSDALFVEQVNQAIVESGIDPSQLVVEITEHGLINDLERCGQTLQGLHDLGVRIALDDFGTGYSSLSHLHRLPVDIVKIDRSFVSNFGTGPGINTQLVRSIVTMATMLHLETIAEGVETHAQLAALIDIGCFAGQGWGIACPASLDDIKPLLRDARDGVPSAPLDIAELLREIAAGR